MGTHVLFLCPLHRFQVLSGEAFRPAVEACRNEDSPVSCSEQVIKWSFWGALARESEREDGLYVSAMKSGRLIAWHPSLAALLSASVSFLVHTGQLLAAALSVGLACAGLKAGPGFGAELGGPLGYSGVATLAACAIAGWLGSCLCLSVLSPAQARSKPPSNSTSS